MGVHPPSLRLERGWGHMRPTSWYCLLHGVARKKEGVKSLYSLVSFMSIAFIWVPRHQFVLHALIPYLPFPGERYMNLLPVTAYLTLPSHYLCYYRGLLCNLPSQYT